MVVVVVGSERVRCVGSGDVTDAPIVQILRHHAKVHALPPYGGLYICISSPKKISPGFRSGSPCRSGRASIGPLHVNVHAPVYMYMHVRVCAWMCVCMHLHYTCILVPMFFYASYHES